MKRVYLALVTVFFLLIMSTNKIDAMVKVPVDMNAGSDTSRKTLDEMLKELKEQRKIIEQRKLDEIEAKRLEKQQREQKEIHIKSEETKSNENDMLKNEKVDKVEKNKVDIPTLIVRLRGKHTDKYLCGYSFIVKTDNSEKLLEREVVSDYSNLLKRVTLKVRANEVINFEFSEKPSNLNVYIWGEKNEYLKAKRGCIRVPDIDGKIVVVVEGIYKNGYIKYAVVLDIRR